MTDFPFTTIQLAWLSALESGNYKQGQGMLRSGDYFCCLGVAAKYVLGSEEANCKGVYSYDGSLFKLSDSGSKVLGLKSSTGMVDLQFLSKEATKAVISIVEPLTDHVSLANLNDQGFTFSKIAALIRENPHAVFTNGDKQ